jgi:hypothetical protein
MKRRRRAVFEIFGSNWCAATGPYMSCLPCLRMADMAVPKVPGVDPTEEQRRKTPQGTNSET